MHVFFNSCLNHAWLKQNYSCGGLDGLLCSDEVVCTCRLSLYLSNTFVQVEIMCPHFDLLQSSCLVCEQLNDMQRYIAVGSTSTTTRVLLIINFFIIQVTLPVLWCVGNAQQEQCLFEPDVTMNEQIVTFTETMCPNTSCELSVFS